MKSLLGIVALLGGAVTYLLARLAGKAWKIPYNEPVPSLDNLTTVPITPPQPPTSPVVARSMLEVCADGIKEFEGWIPPGGKDASGKVYPTGSPAWRCKNPGNMKDIHGVEMVFPTEEAGYAYLENYLTRVATGKHPAYKPTMNLMQMMHVYTGDAEPSPTNYANFLAKRLGVDVHTWQVKNLVAPGILTT